MSRFDCELSLLTKICQCFGYLTILVSPADFVPPPLLI
jgi:hypothetical protein